MPNERRQDIFGNSDFGEGQSAATVAQGVPNQSKATAIQGLQYAEPLIGQLAAGLAERKNNEGDANKYQSLTNLETRLGQIEEAAQMKGGITKQQARRMQFDEAERFRQDNPHLIEDIDATVKRTQEVYGFTEESDDVAGMREGRKNIAKQVSELGLIPKGQENDPAVVDEAISRFQTVQAKLQENKILADQVTQEQAQLNLVKTKKDMSIQDMEIESKIRQDSIDRKIYNMNLNAPVIDQEAINVNSNHIMDVLIPFAAKEKAGDNTARPLTIKTLQESKVAAIQNYQRINPDFAFLSASEQDRRTKLVTAQYDTTIDALIGKESAEAVQNKLNIQKNLDVDEIINGPLGEEVRNAQAVRTLFGDNNPMLYQKHYNVASNILTSGGINADETTNPNFFEQVDKKPVELIYGSVDKAVKRANASKPEDMEKNEKEAFVQLGSAINAIKPREDGKPIEGKDLQRALSSLADDSVGKYVVRAQPQWDEKKVEQADYLMRKLYSEPTFKFIADEFSRSMGTGTRGNQKSGMPIRDAVLAVWQDGKVVLKPKEGLSPNDRKATVEAIDTLKPRMPFLTDIVKGSAHLHNSDDYAGFLDTFTNRAFGVENISNTPASQEDTAVSAYVTERAKAIGTPKSKAEEVVAKARYDIKQNASPSMVKSANEFEQRGFTPLTPEEIKNNASNDITSLISQEQTSNQPITKTAASGDGGGGGQLSPTADEDNIRAFLAHQGLSPADQEKQLATYRESIRLKMEAP